VGGLGVFVVRVNPREYRRSKISESVDGESELFMLAVNTDCRRSVIIAQREPGSDLEVFPTAGGDRGNPREFWEKRSGESGSIHPVSWQCRPHTASGSRTEPAGGHKLERVCDLRFCAFCVFGVTRTGLGGVVGLSPHEVGLSGSRTEPAGGHKLERVCDLRFFVVRSGRAVKVSRLRELVDNSPCYLLTPGTQVLSVRRDHELRASSGSVTG